MLQSILHLDKIYNMLILGNFTVVVCCSLTLVSMHAFTFLFFFFLTEAIAKIYSLIAALRHFIDQHTSVIIPFKNINLKHLITVHLDALSNRNISSLFHILISFLTFIAIKSLYWSFYRWLKTGINITHSLKS